MYGSTETQRAVGYIEVLPDSHASPEPGSQVDMIAYIQVAY